MRARSLRLILGLLTAFGCASLVVAARAQVQAPTRQGQSTTTLADGRVLIAGGDHGRHGGSLRPVYQPDESGGGENGGRACLPWCGTAANGNVLIVGGYVSGSASVEQGAEIFDVETAQFTKVGGARVARVLAALTLRADGIVRISGGEASGSVEFYDPGANTFGDDPAHT